MRLHRPNTGSNIGLPNLRPHTSMDVTEEGPPGTSEPIEPTSLRSPAIGR